MPGLLEAMSSGLRAGLSLPQSLEAAAEDLPEPSAALARRLLAGLRLGQVPEALMLAEAATHGRHALASDWRLLSTAVAIQRQSGGDLAAVLDQITETLRERQRLQAQIDALTAQGKLSAWVLGCLPLALLLALQILDPDLVAPLFNTPTGWALLGAAVLLEAAGVLLLRRIVDIEA
jgi:tight adherence protein B